MAAAPPNAQYPALYRSCMKEAAGRGRTLMQKVAATAVRSMTTRAAATADVPERNLLTEAARILMKHESALCMAYPQALLAEFATAIGGVQLQKGDFSFDSLELMGDEQMRESVESVRMQQTVQNAVEAEMADLNGLVCAVQGLKTVQLDRNPLRPEVYVRSLRTVTMESPVPHAVRSRWMRHLGEALGPELALVYQELAIMLRSQGVTSARYAVSLAPDSAAAGSRTHAASTPDREAPLVVPAPAVPPGQARSLLNLTELRRLLSGEITAPVENFAARFAREFESGNQAAAPPTEFSLTVPAAFEALQEMKQVDQVMQRLQERRATPPLQPRDLGGAAALREHIRLSATAPGQALGLEVVNLMVDNIANDVRLLAPVQQAVRDLEPALMRLVMHDPRFFSDKKHPARLLLEEMTQRSLAWQSDDAPGFAVFMDALQQGVEALLGTHIDGAEPFAFALASLQEAWGELQDRDRRNRAKAVRALLNAEQRNLLAEKVSLEMRARPDVKAASRELGSFIAGPWSQVIAQARLLDHTGAADPAGYGGLVQDLLWSAQPRLAGSNPARLARMIPPLLEKLRHGLASIDYRSAQTQRFFDHLISLHQQALAPQSARLAVVTQATAREQLEAEFTDSSVEPWIAPVEAKHSGFMETREAEYIQPVFQATSSAFDAAAGEAERIEPVPTLSGPELQTGTWVELLADGTWKRYQLTWASPHGTLFMFSAAGGATQSMTRRLLDKMLGNASMRLVSGQAVVDGALDAVAQAALRNSLDLSL